MTTATSTHLHACQQSELEELDYDLLEETGGPASSSGGGGSAGGGGGSEAPGGTCFSEAWDDHHGGGTEHLAEQSECQSFFSHNLDLLARLADLVPDKIMDMVVRGGGGW